MSSYKNEQQKKSMKTNTSRRQFLKFSAASIAGAMAGAGVGLPLDNMAFAKLPGNKKMILIQLAGGMDHLTLFPPVGDADYLNQRAQLALKPHTEVGGALKIDDLFGLHPMAEALYPFWARNELTYFPAAGLPFKGNSHKAANMFLETGVEKGLNSGWLGRALSLLGASKDDTVFLGNEPPAILRHSSKKENVNLIDRAELSAGYMQRMYETHHHDTLLAPALIESEKAAQRQAANLPQDDKEQMTTPDAIFGLENRARLVAKVMTQKDGANVGVFKVNGWDSHKKQGSLTGQLPRRLAALSGAIEAIANEMGKEWKNTVIVVCSESGRSVIPNKAGGTDNGAAGGCLLIGGAIRQSRIVGAWPGLDKRNLTATNGLKQTIDLRAIFKTVLKDHLGLSEGSLAKTVFPNTDNIPSIPGLIV